MSDDRTAAAAAPPPQQPHPTQQQGRSSKACDRCHQLKVRCIVKTTGEEPAAPCLRCVQAGVECKFTPSSARRGPRSRSRAAHSDVSSDSPAATASSNNAAADGFRMDHATQLAFVHYFFDHLATLAPVLHKQMLLAAIERPTHAYTAVAVLPALNALVAHFIAHDSASPVALRPSINEAAALFHAATALADKFLDLTVESMQTLLILSIAALARNDTYKSWLYLTRCSQMLINPPEISPSFLAIDDVIAEMKRRVFWDRSLSNKMHSPFLIKIDVADIPLPMPDSIFQSLMPDAQLPQVPALTIQNWSDYDITNCPPGLVSFLILTTNTFGKIVESFLFDITKRRHPLDPNNRYEMVAKPFQMDTLYVKWVEYKTELANLYQSFPATFHFSSQHDNLQPMSTVFLWQYEFTIMTTFHYARLLLHCPLAFTLQLPLPVIPWISPDIQLVVASAEEMVKCAHMITSSDAVAVSANPLCGGALFISFMVYLSEYYLLQKQMETVQEVTILRDAGVDVHEQADMLKENIKACTSAVKKLARFWHTARGIESLMRVMLDRNNLSF